MNDARPSFSPPSRSPQPSSSGSDERVPSLRRTCKPMITRRGREHRTSRQMALEQKLLARQIGWAA